jgi:hypothetical protein
MFFLCGKKGIAVIQLFRKRGFFVSRKVAKAERTNSNFQAPLFCFSGSRICSLLGKMILGMDGIGGPRGFVGDRIIFPGLKPWAIQFYIPTGLFGYRSHFFKG